MQFFMFAMFLLCSLTLVQAQVKREHFVLPRGASGPYSHAVRVGNTMYFSGLHVGNITGMTFGQEIHRILDHMKSLLESGRLTLKHVAKTTVFLKNWNNYDEMNNIYREYFTEKFPARSALQVVRLPRECRVAIDAVAVHSDL